MPGSRTLRRTFTVLAVSVVAATGFTGSALATPPGIPSESTARTELAALTVQADGSQDGYSRDKFPHWIDQGDSCNTRFPGRFEAVRSRAVACGSRAM